MAKKNKKLIKNASLEVRWPINMDVSLNRTIRKVAKLIQEQYPTDKVWIDSIFVTDPNYVGQTFDNNGHKVTIKAHPENHILRDDHVEILFLLKPY